MRWICSHKTFNRPELSLYFLYPVQERWVHKCGAVVSYFGQHDKCCRWWWWWRSRWWFPPGKDELRSGYNNIIYAEASKTGLFRWWWWSSVLELYVCSYNVDTWRWLFATLTLDVEHQMRKDGNLIMVWKSLSVGWAGVVVICSIEEEGVPWFR